MFLILKHEVCFIPESPVPTWPGVFNPTIMARCKASTKSGKRCSNSAAEGSEFCHIKSHNKAGLSESKLNAKQERFCQLFVSKEFFGHGTESYAEAYDISLSENYNTAAANASRMLKNANILERINELLESNGLNDEFVDKQLLFLITQSSDFSQKMAAIREYNKIRARIVNRHDHTSSDGSMSPKTLDDFYNEDRGNE